MNRVLPFCAFLVFVMMWNFLVHQSCMFRNTTRGVVMAASTLEGRGLHIVH